jgi:microcompartment protein CcmL/EutN
MMNSIGFLEMNSIAKGVEAADSILKTAAVELLFAKAGCPGKYYILFTGEVAAVQASLETGCTIGGERVVDSCVIPRIHPQVIRAINMTNLPEEMRAIGVMEFFSVTAMRLRSMGCRPMGLSTVPLASLKLPLATAS